jgi:S-DNA-T family DNA segregation ATPase FtsK/SpoIIIE
MTTDYDATIIDLAASRPATAPPAAPLVDHDQADDGPRVLVDSPEAQRPARRTPEGIRAAQRRPIVPAWARSAGELRATLAWVAFHYAHTSVYHGVRVPKYAGRLVARTPRGASRALTSTARWITDAESRPVRVEMAARKDRDSAETFLKLVKRRDAHLRNRGTVALIAATVALGLGLWLWLAASPTAQGLALAATITTLGILGAPADRPLLDTAVVVSKATRLTSEHVVRALGTLGLAGINQALAKSPKGAIGFAAPITRDGRGWRADIDLPPGTTAGEIINRRDKLASGLGRPLGCVWPEAVHEISPGRLLLYVADDDLAAARQPAWPLARTGAVNLFRPFPFGTDPRGRTVMLDLAYGNLLVGSVPGAGKTASLRLPLLAAALDPLVELQTFELKGAGDMEALAQVSTRYASGLDDDTIEEALVALRDLRRECVRRAATIKELPRVQAPEYKVTPELARRRQLGLHLVVCAIDECQELFTHPVFGAEAAELAEKVVKLGRALGIILLLATQRPDAASLPTGIRANIAARFCLRVMDQQANDMVLPTSSYQNGVRATMFTSRDKGVGWLVGGEDPQIVRTYYVDGTAAERIATRARAARQAAGTLSGYAAGQEIERAGGRRDTLLEDVLGVIPAAEDKTPAEVLLQRLAEAHPDRYGEQTTDQLTAALRAYGIDTAVQVHRLAGDGQRRNRRGVRREQIVEVAAERDRRRGLQ